MSIDNEESIQAGKEAFLQITSRLDLLINNAGLGSDLPYCYITDYQS